VLDLNIAGTIVVSVRFSSADYRYKSFVEEYDDLIANGEVSGFQLLPNYVRYARAEAKRLMLEKPF